MPIPITIHLDEATKQLIRGLSSSVNILSGMIGQDASGNAKLAAAIRGLTDLLAPSLEREFRLIRVEDIDTHLVIEGEITAMQLTDTQKAAITFGGPLDAKRKPAKAENIKIEVVDGVSATVQPNPADPTNPLSALIVAGDPTPDQGVPTAIHISGDADLGEGVKLIESFVPMLVTSGQAVGFGAPTEGTPEEQ